MSFSSVENKKQYSTGGGVDTFSFPYPFQQTSDLVVKLKDSTTLVTTTLVEGVDYNITPVGDTGRYESGSIVTTSVYAAGSVLTIQRIVDNNQDEANFNPGGDFDEQTTEDSFDKAMMAAQQNANRAIILKGTDNIDGPLELPDLGDNAGKILQISSDGNSITAAETADAADARLTNLFDGPAADDIFATFINLENGALILDGTGSPEGVKVAPEGSLYIRNGASGLINLYQKKSGGGNTGWEGIAYYINVRDYGVTGDGVTDDTVAMQACLAAAAGRTIIVPKGTYIISTKLTATRSVKLYGEGADVTVFEFQDCDGFDITNGHRQKTEIKDIRFTINTIKTRVGVSITNGVETGVEVDACLISDCAFTGEDYDVAKTFGWLKAIYLKATVADTGFGGTIIRNFIKGPETENNSGFPTADNAGIYIDTMTAITISDNQIYHSRYGIYVEGASESILVNNNLIVAVGYGYYVDTGTNANVNHHDISHNHVSALYRCIFIESSDDITDATYQPIWVIISNNSLFDRDSSTITPATNYYEAIELSTKECIIADNSFVALGTNISPSLGHVGVRLADGQGALIENNQFRVHQSPVIVDNGAVKTMISNNLASEPGTFNGFVTKDTNITDKDVLQFNNVTGDGTSFNPSIAPLYDVYGNLRVRSDTTNYGGMVIDGHDGTSTSAAEVTTTDATVTALKQITLDDDSTYHVRALIVGVAADGTNRASYDLIATFYRTGAGNSVRQGITVVHSVESDAAWNADLTVGVTNSDIRVLVTGAAATEINWGATLEYTKISQ